MRWSAWPRPNEPRSTSCTWQRRKKKGLANEIVLDRTRLIQVELEKDALACGLDLAEDVLGPRIVVGVEGAEGLHLCQHFGLSVGAERDHARGHQYGAAGQCAPERVVELADLGRAFGVIDHVVTP